MAKSTESYVCSACGARSAKWSGRCQKCGEWDTIGETPDAAVGDAWRGSVLELSDLGTAAPPPARVSTGVRELDRVLGGGIVPASAVLIGGDPGVGKSTLLLQAAAEMARNGSSVIYFSGEEAVGQIQMRSARLGLDDAPVRIASATGIRDILATMESERPDLAIIDSIQTMWADGVDSAPGTISQVRTVANATVRFAKNRGTAAFLVGHVTKEGQIAGPRVVEHLVDTVVYFESERGHQFRILRAVKNRFGPADEIGVFEMTSLGLSGVDNTSALFLSERDASAPGSAVYAGIEGTRPILVEMQALVANSAFAAPRRTAVGWDGGRMAMMLAVLDARCGISFAGQDVYLNVAGGIRVTEPAADLAAAGALLSAKLDRPLPSDTVVFGEVSLSGTLRSAPQPEQRLKEAEKLGFAAALAPTPAKTLSLAGITTRHFADLAEFAAGIAAPGGAGGREAVAEDE